MQQSVIDVHQSLSAVVVSWHTVRHTCSSTHPRTSDMPPRRLSTRAAARISEGVVELAHQRAVDEVVAYMQQHPEKVGLCVRSISLVGRYVVLV